MELANHTLYFKDTCPYCLKVLEFMENHDIKMETADAWEDANYEKLLEIGGLGQVPCLVIDGNAMYESEDIIAYLTMKILDI